MEIQLVHWDSLSLTELPSDRSEKRSGEEGITWHRTKTCLSEVCLPLACKEEARVTCLRGLHDKFPTTWLCHTVCHLDNNWGHSRVVERWHRGLRREGPLSLTTSIYFRSACSTSWLIHLKKSSGVKINKTLLTVVFSWTSLLVTINHAFKVSDTSLILTYCCEGVKLRSTEMNVILQKRKHVKYCSFTSLEGLRWKANKTKRWAGSTAADSAL